MINDISQNCGCGQHVIRYLTLYHLSQKFFFFLIFDNYGSILISFFSVLPRLSFFFFFFLRFLLKYSSLALLTLVDGSSPVIPDLNFFITRSQHVYSESDRFFLCWFYIKEWAIGLVSTVFAFGPWDRSSIPVQLYSTEFSPFNIIIHLKTISFLCRSGQSGCRPDTPSGSKMPQAPSVFPQKKDALSAKR